MLIARLPHRLREYRYHLCHDDLDDQTLGFVVTLKFIPCWITGSWKLTVSGRNWAEETNQEYTPDQVALLRITGEKVTISELAWIMYRAQQVVDVAREVLGDTANFEQAATLTLDRQHRIVVRAVMANQLNDRHHLRLLETECFLLSISPSVEKKE